MYVTTAIEDCVDEGRERRTEALERRHEAEKTDSSKKLRPEGITSINHVSGRDARNARQRVLIRCETSSDAWKKNLCVSCEQQEETRPGRETPVSKGRTHEHAPITPNRAHQAHDGTDAPPQTTAKGGKAQMPGK